MIRTCESCGQRNRIPVHHLAHEGRCGKCKRALPPLAQPLSVGPDDFREIVRRVQVPVLVDFWADWCGPCKRAAPEVEKVATEWAGRAVVLKVDTQAHPELAREFGVSGIPNFVVLRNGKVALQQAGLVSHRQMGDWLRQAG